MGIIMHKGVAYGGGGSDIEPNPSGSATEDLTKLGIDDTNYNVADADYRSDQKTYTFKVYDTNTHKYGSSSVGSTTTIRGVISAISALFDSVKTAINDHADVLTAINTAISSINNALSGKADKTNATYTKLTGSGHRFGDIDISQSAPFTSSDVSTIENANMAKIKTIVNNLADYAEENASDVASTKTTSGNPLTLTDAAPINAEKLEVVLEPKQDLHGYDFPWVGGAGKNKFGGTYNTLFPLHFATDTEVCASCAPVSGDSNANIRFYNVDQQEIDWWGLDRATPRNKKAFTLPSTAYYVKFAGAESTEYQIELGQTATTFAPYSNICPISGYDSVSVDDVGFNVFDEVMETGLLQQDGSVSSAYTTRLTSSFIEVLPDTDYYYSNDYILSGRSAYYDENKTCIAAYTSGFQTKINRTPSNAHYVRFSPTSSYGAVYNHDICVNISKPTGTPKNGDYLPYQSTTTSITFGQTVYGGTVDFNTGVVTITDANIASYARETLPSTWISDRDAYSSGGTPTTGAQVVYKLATPTTLQLTPQELKLLQNTNNISTNGTTITLGYQPNNVIGELKADLETHLDMPWLQVLYSGQTIDFNDILLFDDSSTVLLFTLADLEVFKHRFLLVEVYRKSNDSDLYINASLLLNVDTLYSAEYGYNSSLGMGGGITAAFNISIHYNQGNYKIKAAIHTDASSPLTNIYIRARLVD